MRVTLGLSVLLFATLAWAQAQPVITEYPVTGFPPNVFPQVIIVGPDGALWFPVGGFIEKISTSGVISTVTQANAGPFAFTPDGSIWYADVQNRAIAKLSTSGAVTEYAVPSGSYAQTFCPFDCLSAPVVGADGSLWFTDHVYGPGARAPNVIYSMTTSGVVTSHATSGNPQGIILGKDGAIWFTEAGISYTNLGNFLPFGAWVGRIDPAGNLTEFPLANPEAVPGSVVWGSDGALWCLTRMGISRVTVAGVETAFSLGNLAASTLAAGADEAIWFSDSRDNLIGRMTTSGVISQYPLLTATSNPGGIVSGPDGAIWFTTVNGIDRLAIGPAPSLAINSSPLQPSGTTGSPYLQTFTVTGGTAPYQWSLQSGALPAGLTLTNGNGPSVTISGVPTQAGPATFTLSATDATGLSTSRTFTVYIGTPGCAFMLSSSFRSFPAVGGVGTFSITTPPGCAWSIVASSGWVAIPDGNYTGSGSGTVHYAVSANDSLSLRSVVLNVGGQSFTVQEEGGLGGAGLQFVSSTSYFSPEMPHLAAGGGWRTSFTLVNNDSVPSQVWTSFYGDDGNLLSLPLTFAQRSSQNTFGSTWIDQMLAPNQSLIFEASVSGSSSFAEGLATVTANVGSSSHANVSGFSIFHYDPTGQEAVVPLGGSGYVIPFDNTNGVSTGIAIASSNLSAISYPISLLDDAGNQIGTGDESVTLPAYGHTSFVLPDKFPVTANKRGTVILGNCDLGFHIVRCTTIGTLGIRYTPPGTLTTIPSLGLPSIQVPPFTTAYQEPLGGGIMPHIASGSGWQTTFVLSNVPPVPNTFAPAFGSSPQDATLSFFDDNGNPLTLPLTFPQTGATMAASSVTQTIPANGSLYIQTSGDVGTALLTGSAQLTGVSGFAIFRYNPNGQEAVVPMQGAPKQSDTASVLAFDNTNNIATGVAIRNGSAQAVSVPVVIRDDQGNQIGTSAISLAANGHTSFVLATHYPATANTRGTLEFSIPNAGTANAVTIGVLGIRSPPQLTFTTLPALPK